jgi:hypothetical protein
LDIPFSNILTPLVTVFAATSAPAAAILTVVFTVSAAPKPSNIKRGFNISFTVSVNLPKYPNKLIPRKERIRIIPKYRNIDHISKSKLNREEDDDDDSDTTDDELLIFSPTLAVADLAASLADETTLLTLSPTLAVADLAASLADLAASLADFATDDNAEYGADNIEYDGVLVSTNDVENDGNDDESKEEDVEDTELSDGLLFPKNESICSIYTLS